MKFNSKLMLPEVGTDAESNSLQAGTACGCGLCTYALRTSSAYQEFFACAMATGMAEYEEQIAPTKQKLFAAAFERGPVQSMMEIGMGTGPNLRHIPPSALEAGEASS